MVTKTELITEDELLRMGAEGMRVEIVDGEIVEIEAGGFGHALIGCNIYDTLDPHIKKYKLGTLLMAGLIYVLETGSEPYSVWHSRISDLSFIKRGNIPDFDFERPYPGVPDFVVEILSPDEDETKTRERIRDFLERGTTEGWMVYPDQQEVHVYRRDDPKNIRVYTLEDSITTDLFPGLTIAVKDFFDFSDVV